MDAASPGPSVGESDHQALVSRAPSRLQWLWTPLALGAGFALVSMSLQQLAESLGMSLIFRDSYFYTHQLQFNALLTAVDTLAVPLILTVAACVVAFRIADSRRRGVAVARLLSIVLLLLGAAWLLQFSSVTEFSVVTNSIIVASAASTPATMVAMLLPGVTGFALGVTVAVAFGLLPSWLTPQGNARRLGYMTLASILAGVTVALFTLLDRVLLFTPMAVRLAAVGMTDCTAGSGCAGYYERLILNTVASSALPLIIGATIGGAIGGVLAPALAEARSPDGAAAPSSPTPPEDTGAQATGRRRSRVVAALRYVAGAAIGVVYIAIALVLANLASRIPNLMPATDPNAIQPVLWSVMIEALFLLIPLGWLALAGERARFARALSPERKRAVLRTLKLLAVLLAVAIFPIAMLTHTFNYLNGLPIIPLAAFALGAAYGLLWAPQPPAPRSRPAWQAGVRAAATGWLGVSLLIASLLGIAFYSLVTFTPSSLSCHGLGCGAVVFAFYAFVITIGFNIILFGLPAALVAGGLSGMIREALRTP